MIKKMIAVSSVASLLLMGYSPSPHESVEVKPTLDLKQFAPMLRTVNPTDIHVIPTGIPVNKVIITSAFGFRIHPTLKQRKLHTGIDFSGTRKDTVFATAPGVITHIEHNRLKSTYGLNVGITHDETYETKYAHMSRLFVKDGQQLNEGDPIGLMGNTGRSAGVHLHYEIYRNGKPVDPAEYILEEPNL